MDRKINYKRLIPSILLPVLVGALAAFLTRDNFADYEQLYKPLFSPPGAVFGIVWTILYILMGIACYRIIQKEASKPRKARALKLYAGQLIINFLWPIIFFNFQMYTLACLWAALLLLLVFFCWLLFEHIDKWAGRLFVPYLLWCAYALYLSAGVALLN